MTKNSLSVSFRAHGVDDAVASIRQSLKTNRDLDCDDAVVQSALLDLLSLRADDAWSDVRERLTDPQYGADISEFEELVRARMAKPESRASELTSVNGYREFSFDKLSAMIVHLAYRGKNVSQTRLNKLLFYSDFSHFAAQQVSMSGAAYTALTHGPIYDDYKNAIKTLEESGKINVRRFSKQGMEGQTIYASNGYRPERSFLSAAELKLLDWVIETYDHLPTDELIKLSHRETAYWNSHYRELIDYKYAAELEHQPPSFGEVRNEK